MLEMGTGPFLVILRLNLTRVKSISGDLSSSGSGCEANASCAEVSKSPRLAFLRYPRRPFRCPAPLGANETRSLTLGVFFQKKRQKSTKP